MAKKEASTLSLPKKKKINKSKFLEFIELTASLITYIKIEKYFVCKVSKAVKRYCFFEIFLGKRIKKK